MALTFAGARLPTLALGRFLKSLVVGAIVVVLMVDGGLGWCMVDHDVQLHGGNDVWWSVVVGGRIDRSSVAGKWREKVERNTPRPEPYRRNQTLSQDYFFRPAVESQSRSGNEMAGS